MPESYGLINNQKWENATKLLPKGARAKGNKMADLSVL